MQKTAPTAGRIAVMVAFALSCFGLLLFLWMSFGGDIPFKPRGYRFEAGFPKAVQLGVQADVREAGVSVGHVVAKRVSPDGRRTLATIELDDRYAPIHRDARVMLRTKTVGGETYVAILRGTAKAPLLREGARLPDSRVGQVQTIEDVLQLFDRPTRARFRAWQQSFGQALGGHGTDLNAALGTLPRLTDDAGNALSVLDDDRRRLSSLVRDSASAFGALSADGNALRRVVTGLNTTFSATARQDAALARSFRRFPGFLVQSRRTLSRLHGFADDADPLVVKLRPALEQLPDTVHQARLLAPDLRRLFTGLGPAFTAARTGLPATAEVLEGVRPVFGEIGPFLGELNPVLRWIEQNQGGVTDFLSAGINALGSTAPAPGTPDTKGHYLRQVDPGGAEAVAVWPQRLPTNRGDAYNNELDNGPLWQLNGIAPVFDCRNAGGPRPAGPDAPACYVQPKRTLSGKPQGQFPHIDATDYAKGG
jgi:virulence factor Mce-like protein